MKRSEMIDIMLTELSKNAFKTKGEKRSAMEHILWRMEEAGMLPPLVKQDFLDSDNQDYAFMSEWEPEEDDMSSTEMSYRLFEDEDEEEGFYE